MDEIEYIENDFYSNCFEYFLNGITYHYDSGRVVMCVDYPPQFNYAEQYENYINQLKKIGLRFNRIGEIIAYN